MRGRTKHQPEVVIFKSLAEAEGMVMEKKNSFALKEEEGKKWKGKTRIICDTERMRKLEKDFSVKRQDYRCISLRGISFIRVNLRAEQAAEKIRSVFK